MTLNQINQAITRDSLRISCYGGYTLFSWFEKSGAEAGLHWSEIGLLVFAAFVAVGLVGEYQKEKSERWKSLFSTFELLVVIGVVGEVLFDGLIFGFSGRLSQIQDKEVASATLAAATATTAAGKATTEAGKAGERAGAANELAGQANERAAKTNERAAILERENIELRKLIEVRDVNDDQSSKLVKAIDGKKETVILVLPNDGEARAYAIVGLKPALQKANFIVKNEDFGSTAKNIDIIVCESGATPSHPGGPGSPTGSTTGACLRWLHAAQVTSGEIRSDERRIRKIAGSCTRKSGTGDRKTATERRKALRGAACGVRKHRVVPRHYPSRAFRRSAPSL